jgi:hypothetical protein
MSFADYLENKILDHVFGATAYTDYLPNNRKRKVKILDHVFGATAYTAPATIYVALSTADPLDSGSGLAEPSGNVYACVAVTNNTTNFPNASGGAKSNGTAIIFPQATGSWGTVTHVALMDASSGGNMLGSAALASSKAVGANDTLSFAVGDLDITLL